ncbi:oxidoreductase, short chain dehydrogenase/reductase family [Sporothrix brasiliensis 5110]|uniref:Oxidoreductase, short chain dehydrogenase/reductase family n=1 Tax=Sporothrix brasiliensis 5110 TaxID=1398154 RepID=A0A0C2FGW0_9PEZI|nr:oxidoreductase, short chain dehydrogenase/reductase family [Sporothrix brasiliensis 5110]KIH90308.1 oxidoreductase, short chain dehydrogenase/reductase family [Sporothrix brasiliensis 5110]
MPLDFITNAYLYGLPEWFPEPETLVKFFGTLGVLVGTKVYCSGASNRSDRSMHGRVVMITGGTSGVGAAVALDLAKRGAHIVLLTQQPSSDPFVVDYVEELRELAGHQLIYAEQVDLTSLHSIRTFATQWIDNLPVRRLDMIILCAAVAGVAQTDERTGKALAPARGVTTADGIERAWMVNYLANFHLLGILSPALRSQPFDRDVRIIITTCSSYIGSPPLIAAPASTASTTTNARGSKKKAAKAGAAASTTPDGVDIPDWSPARAYARSKLALMVFARSFQKHVDAHKRPDNLPGNVRVLVVDPGMSRTPGFRHWLTGGSLLWLVLGYVLLYPLWWLFIKSADDGAQSILYAAMDGELRRMRDFGTAGDALADDAARDPLAHKIIKECRVMDTARRDVEDETVAKALWQDSDLLVEETEKRAAERRQREKEAAKEAAENEERVRKETHQVNEIEALVSAIKKGKEREKEKEAAAKKGDKKKSKRKA